MLNNSDMGNRLMAIDYIQDIRRLAVTFTLALVVAGFSAHGLPAPI